MEGEMRDDTNPRDRDIPDSLGGDSTAAMNPGDEVPPGSPASGEHVCRACGGVGRRDGEPCTECGGTGRVTVAISAGP
jgi:hypothetical protein